MTHPAQLRLSLDIQIASSCHDCSRRQALLPKVHHGGSSCRASWSLRPRRCRCRPSGSRLRKDVCWAARLRGWRRFRRGKDVQIICRSMCRRLPVLWLLLLLLRGSLAGQGEHVLGLEAVVHAHEVGCRSALRGVGEAKEVGRGGLRGRLLPAVLGESGRGGGEPSGRALLLGRRARGIARVQRPACASASCMCATSMQHLRSHQGACVIPGGETSSMRREGGITGRTCGM